MDDNAVKDIHPYYDSISSHIKSVFDDVYTEGSDITRTPKSLWRRDRFLNLYSFALDAAKKNGAIAECGCWKGLSAFVIASAIKSTRPSYLGEDFYIIDSFEGLSVPNVEESDIPFNTTGKFAESVSNVKKNLREFPGISFKKGWIPQVFSSLEKNKYALVHIDVDLADPTLESVKYFYPQLMLGGVIICDDYGGIIWKSMRNHLDLLIKEMSLRTLFFSTGQLVIVKDS